MSEIAKTARKAKVEIKIAGKNVSTDLAPYLISYNFNDKTSTEVDDITLTIDDRDELFVSDWMPERGDKIEVSIKCDNWSDNDSEEELYCGVFEIDLVTESGPPNKFEIKAVSIFNSNIRRVIHTNKWEHTTLKAVCEAIVSRNQMKLIFSGDDVDFDVCDQIEQSDLQFLGKLADDNDFMLKIDDDTLYVLSREELENQPPQLVISKCDINNRRAGAQGFDLYKEAKASYYDPTKKKTHIAKVSHKKARFTLTDNSEWTAAHSTPNKAHKPTATTAKKKPEPTTTKSYLDQANIYGGGKVLHIRQKFHSAKEAETTALALLRKKNRGEWIISGDVMGNPALMAGITVDIVDYGQFSGRYYIDSTTHSVGNSYRTSFTSHRVLGDITNDK